MSTDLLTLAEAKDALGRELTDTNSEELLKQYITGVSERLDQVCGPIVQRTIADELHDGSTSTIWLKETPVASITTLTEYDGTTATVLTRQTPGTQPSNGYVLYDTQGKIVRTTLGNVWKFPRGFQCIKVTYVAGRYTTTNTVTDLFKQAAATFLSHVWQMEQGMGSDLFPTYEGGQRVVTWSLPKRVLDMLGDETKTDAIA